MDKYESIRRETLAGWLREGIATSVQLQIGSHTGIFVKVDKDDFADKVLTNPAKSEYLWGAIVRDPRTGSVRQNDVVIKDGVMYVPFGME